MIGLALRAELRKLRSTPWWWVLLVPAVVVTYLISLLGSAIATLFTDEELRRFGGDFPSLLGVSVAYSVLFTSLLTMCLGISAAAGEMRQKSITTTYLTTQGRSTVLLGKATVYAGLGAIYAAVVVAAATAGGLTIDGWSALPPAHQFIAVTTVGSIVIVLWTVAGVGIGALVGNQVIALVGALVARVLVETLLGVMLHDIGAGAAANILPSTASVAAVRNMATEFAIGETPLRSQANIEDFLPASTITWWVGGGVFVLWVLGCCLGGWRLAARRDVR